MTGDPLRLRQVLDNLLSNVRAHTPIGTTTVVRVSQTEDEAIVEVTDSGPGLDDEQRSRVFERFYRADPSRSRLKGGRPGPLDRQAIVTAHGGTVRAVSLPGQGASFSVHLPLSTTTSALPSTPPSKWRAAPRAAADSPGPGSRLPSV